MCGWGWIYKNAVPSTMVCAKGEKEIKALLSVQYT